MLGIVLFSVYVIEIAIAATLVIYVLPSANPQIIELIGMAETYGINDASEMAFTAISILKYALILFFGVVPILSLVHIFLRED